MAKYQPLTEKDAIQAIMLSDGTRVETDSNQFFDSSETGNTIRLWQREPLRLLKTWRRERVMWLYSFTA